MSVPDGKETITAEGRDLRAAIQGAAQQLGLHPAQVDYKLDLTHFRSVSGAPVARDTVRIIAWGSGRAVPEGRAAEEQPRLEERAARAEVSDGGADGANGSGERAARPPREDGGERRERRDRGDRGDRAPRSADQGDRAPRSADQGDRGGDRDRGDRGGDRRRGRRGGRDEGGPRSESDRPRPEAGRSGGDEPRTEKPESLRGAEAGPTEASDFAQRWFMTLMELMGVVGTVEGTGSAERVHLAVKAERAGRIVGKRGATSARSGTCSGSPSRGSSAPSRPADR